MKPDDAALYDKVIEVNLDTIEPVIALPFHPSNVYSLKEILSLIPISLRAICSAIIREKGAMQEEPIISSQTLLL